MKLANGGDKVKIQRVRHKMNGGGGIKTVQFAIDDDGLSLYSYALK